MMSRTTALTLRQHWRILAFPVATTALVVGCAVGYALQFAEPLALVVALLALLWLIPRIHAWMVFELTITHRGIAIREVRWGLPHSTLYPYSAVRSLCYTQHPIDWLADTGSLHLTLATSARQFHALTSFELLRAILA